MPKNHSVFVGTYQLYVTNRGEADERVSLLDVDGAGTRFLDWAADFIDTDVIQNAGSETEIMRYQREEVYEEPDAVYGRIWCGETGVAENIIHEATGDARQEKRVDDAGMIPYYFHLNAGSNDVVAVLALQRLGLKGPYGYFSGPFWNAFRDRFPDRVLHIEPAITPEIVSALRSAPVKRVTFSTYNRSSDPMEGVVADSTDLIFRSIISARRGKFVRLKQDISGFFESIGGSNREPAQMPEAWKHLGDRAAITLSVNGRERTITVGLGRDIVPYEEIPTTRDDYDERGWPIIDFVHRYAVTAVQQLRRRWRRGSAD